MSENYNFPRLQGNNSIRICVDAPSSISLSPISGTQVTVTWAAVTIADEYTLQRGEAGDFSDAADIYTGGNTTFVDSGLDLDTTYYYRVMASKVTYCDSGWTSDSVTTDTPESTGTDITAFSFSEQSGDATINGVYSTVDIEVITGTSLSSLIPTFTLSLGASAAIEALGSDLLVNAWDDSAADVSEAGGTITFSNTGNVCDHNFINPSATMRLIFDCTVTGGSFQIRRNNIRHDGTNNNEWSL